MALEQTNSEKYAPNRTTLIICLLLTIVVVILYRHVVEYEFVRFDDNLYVFQNGIVQSGITSDGIQWAFNINEHFYWHPLTWLSHMLDCQLYGLNAGMHHVTNLILHTLNSLLLFLVLQVMTGSNWRSAFVALLFAIHPINVESVAWISSRKNVLSTFFWLLTMAGYTLYCRRPNRLRYWLTLGSFTLGLMAKPMLVTLPCVLLLLDYWPLNRIKLPDKWRVPPSGRSNTVNPLHNQTDHSLWHVILEKIPFFLFSCLAIIFSIIAIKQLGIDVTYESIPLSSRISNALVSYWVYIRQIIWPTGLAFFYPFPETIPLWKPLTSAFFIIALLGLAVKFARQAPYIIIGWLWYLGTLVPAIGLLQTGLWPATSDRFAYVPSIGLFILAVWGFRKVAFRWPWFTPIRTSFIAAAVATSFFMAATHQIKTWQNSSALFRNAIANTKNNFLAHHNLGNVYLAEDNLEKAIAQYDMALKADPRFIETHNSLASALLKQKKIDLAISHFKEATILNPSNAIYRRNYNNARSLKHYLDGITAMQEQRYNEALTDFNRSLALNPNATQAILMKANVYNKTKNYKQAIESYRSYLAFDPTNQSVHLQIAKLYAILGQAQKAANWLQRAILNGFNDWNLINDEVSFSYLKNTKPFLDLMDQYDGLRFGK